MSVTDSSDFDNDEYDEDTTWSEVDINDTRDMVLDSFAKCNYNDNDQDECWKCRECKTLNNLKQTISSHDIKLMKVKCIGCNVTYNPEYTAKKKSSRWDNHIMCTLKYSQTSTAKLNDELNSNPGYVCNNCGIINNDINNMICENCAVDNGINTNHKYHYYYSCPLPLQFIIIPDESSNYSYFLPWRCLNCYFVEYSSYRCCRQCGCKQAIKYELLIFGYCRELENEIDYEFPTVMKKLCLMYYPMMVNQSYDRKFRKLRKYDGFVDEIELDWYYLSKKNDQQCVELEGTETSLFQSYRNISLNIFVWRVQLLINDEDIKHLHNDINNVYIGVKNADYFCLIKGNGECLATHGFNINDDKYDCNRLYTLNDDINKRKMHYVQQIMQSFKHGDVITMIFDNNNKTLSFDINKNRYHHIITNIQFDTLTFYVILRQKGVVIKLI